MANPFVPTSSRVRFYHLPLSFCDQFSVRCAMNAPCRTHFTLELHIAAKLRAIRQYNGDTTRVVSQLAGEGS